MNSGLEKLAEKFPKDWADLRGWESLKGPRFGKIRRIRLVNTFPNNAFTN